MLLNGSRDVMTPFRMISNWLELPMEDVTSLKRSESSGAKATHPVVE